MDTDVTFLQRRPNPGQFSVEGYFNRIPEHLECVYSVRRYTAPFRSRGLFRRLLNLLWAAWFLRGIVHVTGDINYAAIPGFRRSRVLTVLDLEVLSRLNGLRAWVVYWLWFRLPILRVAVVTVISDETRRQLLARVPVNPERVVVIPVSVSPRFRFSPSEFRTQRPVILQVGTKHNKNVARLVEALDGLCCELVIVGRVNSELERKLNQHQVEHRLLGIVDDESLLRAYENCDIVSFCSTHEGFGMPIVEAQSVGRVCVTSNCSSMPEVAGNGACFVDPFDVCSIRAGFERVISDECFREQLIHNGRQNVLQFGPEEIGKRFSAVYRAISESMRVSGTGADWEGTLVAKLQSELGGSLTQNGAGM